MTDHTKKMQEYAREVLIVKYSDSYGIRGYLNRAKTVKEFLSDLDTIIAHVVTETEKRERERKIAEDYGFGDLREMVQAMLDAHYPADVFDGSTGDKGAVFVTKLREALQILTTPSS